MSGRVLIVEDDPFMGALAETLVRSTGRTARLVPTGAEALAQLAEFPPDLILLDLGLPDLSGLEVLRLLRAAKGWGSVRILVLTASHRTEDIIAAKKAGASGYICKPVQPDTLSEMICDLLEQPNLTWIDDYTRAHRLG
ncbi:hypothetical protein GCM10009116_01590 [Brevundimonas basaltis]|uniref:DNA-binding response OmpR family regulator n=1 Tax=Brevundimonas basaltis TaxID=472166 RepID=A0A7W8HZJ5_9CAUL|nr:response regulator [Brevundimonas basaltis]MBB5292819.1 DNA-binding response OmpR family regulator [Brevundimonas basaltis]